MNIVKCKIADFDVSFESDMQKYHKFLQGYLYNFDVADMVLKVSDDEIVYETNFVQEKELKEHPAFFKRFALFRKFAEQIPNFNAVVLHSACFDVDGVGVAFAAHSGTGKTTHMNLWQELLGEKMVVVNGDKPIVRFFDDEPEVPYAYGTPWNGKERLGCNMRTPLKHICFIERSETNYVEQIKEADAIERMLNQVYMPKDPVAMAKTFELMNKLLKSCKLWKIHCNMEPEAAKVAYNAIFDTK